jgi:hypothetical protein
MVTVWLFTLVTPRRSRRYGGRIADHVEPLAPLENGPTVVLPVPLTTVRQPVREIGEAAVAAMLERRVHPGRPARDIFVQCTLVVRQSCGANAGAM